MNRLMPCSPERVWRLTAVGAFELRKVTTRFWPRKLSIECCQGRDVPVGCWELEGEVRGDKEPTVAGV